MLRPIRYAPAGTSADAQQLSPGGGPQFLANPLQLGKQAPVVSHPFAAFPSQFAYAVGQVIPQTPPVQVAVPFPPPLHTVPQVPQFAIFAAVLVSQPFPRLVSQFPYPVVQVIPQAPDVQVAVPFVAVHTVGQVPQCVALVCRLTSQPFARLLSQSAKPALQLIPQTLPAQLAVPFVPLHVIAQLPQ